MHEGRRGAWHGRASARSLLSCVSSVHRSSSSGPNRSRGSIFRTTRYTCGLVIRGISSPSSLLQAQQKSSAHQAQGDVVMPARPGAGLVLVHRNVIPSPTRRGTHEARALRPVGALGLFASAGRDWVLNNRTIPIPATTAIATTLANALPIFISPLPAL